MATLATSETLKDINTPQAMEQYICKTGVKIANLSREVHLPIISDHTLIVAFGLGNT